MDECVFKIIGDSTVSAPSAADPMATISDSRAVAYLNLRNRDEIRIVEADGQERIVSLPGSATSPRLADDRPVYYAITRMIYKTTLDGSSSQVAITDVHTPLYDANAKGDIVYLTSLKR